MEVTMYSKEYLESLPTLCEGQADDLKIDNGDGERVWLGRCGVADGEPFDNPVTIERYDGHAWVEVERYGAV